MRSIFANKSFLFILFTAFLSVLGIGLIIPVIPFIIQNYVGTNQNAVAFYVGLLTSLYAFCQFFAAPVLGALSDKFGRRPILLICQLGSAIGYILFGIGGSLPILFLSRMIDGITGGDISTVFAYISDVTEPKERGKYFGVVGATVGLGFMLGPSIGGLVAHISLSAPLYLAATLTIINMIYGFFFLPESLKQENRMSDFSLHHLNPFIQIKYIFTHKSLMPVMTVGLFYFLAFSQLQAISSVFFKDTLNWTPGNLGLYFLVLGICDMFTQGFLAGKLSPKFGAIKLILAGFLITAIAYFLNAILPVFPYVFLAYTYLVIYALGSGLFEPSFGHLISTCAEPQEQGRVQGASQSVQAVTRIVGPLLAAFLYQFSHSLPWIFCILFSLIGAGLLLQKKDSLQKHVQKFH